MTSIGWKEGGLNHEREECSMSRKRRKDRFRKFMFYTLYTLTKINLLVFDQNLLTYWNFRCSFGPGHVWTILWLYRARDSELYSRTLSYRHQSSRHHLDLTTRCSYWPFGPRQCFYRGKVGLAHHISRSLFPHCLAAVIVWILILGKFCVLEVFLSF